MQLLEELRYIVTVILLCGMTSWLVSCWKDHPEIIDRVIWGLCVGLIIYKIGDAMGLWAQVVIPHF